MPNNFEAIPWRRAPPHAFSGGLGVERCTVGAVFASAIGLNFANGADNSRGILCPPAGHLPGQLKRKHVRLMVFSEQSKRFDVRVPMQIIKPEPIKTNQISSVSENSETRARRHADAVMAREPRGPRILPRGALRTSPTVVSSFSREVVSRRDPLRNNGALGLNGVRP